MRNKRNLLVAGLVLLLASVSLAAWKLLPDLASSTKAPTLHQASDEDEHQHTNHSGDHGEGIDHPHGDDDEHDHGDEHAHDHQTNEDEAGQPPEGHGSESEDHGEESRISESAAKDLNIKIETASSAMVRQTLAVNGRITLDQKSTANVKGRFPGIVRSVSRQPGQEVKAGESLASIESNESLQVYSVPSPISGTILSRTANVGEIAGDEPIFVVADLRSLVAEIFIFAGDGNRVQQGQKVRIQSVDKSSSAESTIDLLLPTTESSSQTLLARARVQNGGNHWRPGTNIRAEIALNEREVPVAVRTSAIQRIDGKPVVFVQSEKDSFKAQQVELGLSDSEWTEITAGIEDGQSYVATNSFIVKADIGKAGADHEH